MATPACDAAMQQPNGRGGWPPPGPLPLPGHHGRRRSGRRVGGVGPGHKFGISGMQQDNADLGHVMLAYTLMLRYTSTSPYATIFVVLFGWDRGVATAIGGAIVLVYSTTGGMWSTTGVQTIITYFVVYTPGLLIGQDIRQHVSTAKTPA